MTGLVTGPPCTPTSGEFLHRNILITGLTSLPALGLAAHSANASLTEYSATLSLIFYRSKQSLFGIFVCFVLTTSFSFAIHGMKCSSVLPSGSLCSETFSSPLELDEHRKKAHDLDHDPYLYTEDIRSDGKIRRHLQATHTNATFKTVYNDFLKGCPASLISRINARSPPIKGAILVFSPTGLPYFLLSVKWKDLLDDTLRANLISLQEDLGHNLCVEELEAINKRFSPISSVWPTPSLPATTISSSADLHAHYLHPAVSVSSTTTSLNGFNVHQSTCHRQWGQEFYSGVTYGGHHFMPLIRVSPSPSSAQRVPSQSFAQSPSVLYQAEDRTRKDYTLRPHHPYTHHTLAPSTSSGLRAFPSEPSLPRCRLVAAQFPDHEAYWPRPSSSPLPPTPPLSYSTLPSSSSPSSPLFDHEQSATHCSPHYGGYTSNTVSRLSPYFRTVLATEDD